MSEAKIKDQARPAAPATQPATPPHSGGISPGCLWIAVGLVIAAAAGGFWWWSHRASEAENAKKTAATQPAKTIPVVASAATRGDLPIYLNGLGTVTALNTVTVHTRVDGELQKVQYTEGQMVHAGDLLAQIDPRPFEVQLTQAQGQQAKDVAALNNAKLDFARYQTAGEAATQQQRDTAQAAVAQSEGAVKSDQGQIDAAQLQLTYTRITSPITGRIGLRLVDQGNIVHATDANGLMVITEIQPITVVFSLPEDDLPQILKAQKLTPALAAEAWDRDLKNKLTTGKLIAVDNQVDPTTGTVRLKASFTNEDLVLFPNQFVNVRLLVDMKKQAVLIPAAAVQRSPQTTFVYVVKEDETIEMRPITPGPTEGERTSIESGLEQGETVVTDGIDKLQPGMKVKVHKPGEAATQKSPPATRASE